MSYESDQGQALQQLNREVANARATQLKADYRALLTGGMPSSIKITETNDGASEASSVYRPKNATGLLATDYAISDYTTWK